MTTANALFETGIPYTVLYRRFLLYKYLPINTKFVSLNLYFNTYLFHINASFKAKLHSTSLSNYVVNHVAFGRTFYLSILSYSKYFVWYGDTYYVILSN